MLGNVSCTLTSFLVLKLDSFNHLISDAQSVPSIHWKFQWMDEHHQNSMDVVQILSWLPFILLFSPTASVYSSSSSSLLHQRQYPKLASIQFLFYSTLKICAIMTRTKLYYQNKYTFLLVCKFSGQPPHKHTHCLTPPPHPNIWKWQTHACIL
jgi:hypothetical protein